MKDLYPSRFNNQSTIIERKDPVLYNSQSKTGPLHVKELHQYEKDGYLFFPKLFSEEEVAVLRQELNRTLQENKSHNKPHVIKEPTSDEVRSVFDIHNNDQFFKKLASHKRIVRIAEQLLGSQTYITQSRINFKPGFKGKEFDWHSDFETWHVEDGMPRMRAVSCSIILTDNYEYNGPLMLIPGSHKYYIQCAGSTPEDNFKQSLQKQQAGVPDHDSIRWLLEQNGRIDTATGPAGSVLFFECNIMHGSNGNISPLPRSNVFYVFNSIENQLTKPFSNVAPRPEFLANRSDIKPIEAKSFEIATRKIPV